jgi:hypothetical protein
VDTSWIEIENLHKKYVKDTDKYNFIDALKFLGEEFPPDSLKYYGDLKVLAIEASYLMNIAYRQGIIDGKR